MSQENEILGRKTIPCGHCLKEVPLSEARIFEAVDYVAYFCGLECYAKWAAQRPRPACLRPKNQGAVKVQMSNREYSP
jgi:hypothetical protein